MWRCLCSDADINVVATDFDLARPKGNERSPGCTKEERFDFGKVCEGVGLVDMFRRLYPSDPGYTYYGYRSDCRAKGIGWRLDYFLVTQGIVDDVLDMRVYKEVEGSDHVPLSMTINRF